jgi:hypothetical protein
MMRIAPRTTPLLEQRLGNTNTPDPQAEAVRVKMLPLILPSPIGAIVL